MSARARNAAIIVGASILAVAGTVWGLTRNRDLGVDLPTELSVSALKTRMQDPEKALDTVRTVFERQDLTDAQRAQARRNMGQVWRDMLDQHVNEYFAADESDKAAVLDRQIDEFQERMKAMRERWDQERENPSEADREAWRERMRERQKDMSPEARKARSENRSAEDMARRMTYFAAVRQRMTERGIEMPRWGGGGPGGPRRGGGGS